MSLKVSNIFVNLPVKDLQQTIDFFKEIGFDFNPHFTNEQAACLIIGDNIYAMLLVEEYFKTFTKKEIAHAREVTEAIITISADSKEQVNEIVEKAFAAGGKSSKEPVDHGFMYGWGFEDPNGHLWEVFYMDEAAAE